MGIISSLLGAYFILAALLAVIPLLFDRKLYADGRCFECEEYIEKKYGIRKNVYIVDEPVKNKVAFVSTHGIYIYEKLLDPGYKDVLKVVLDHEVKHIQNKDLFKKPAITIASNLFTGIVFITHGLVAGIITVIVIGIIRLAYSLKMELDTNPEEITPEVTDKLKQLLSS